MERRRIWAGLAVAVVGLLLASGPAFAAGPARGVSGKVEGFFNWGISPLSLPKTNPAPIAFRIHTHIRTRDETHPPPTRKLEWEADRHLRIDAQGLPVCHLWSTPKSPSPDEKCRKAAVGGGMMNLEIMFPETPIPAPVKLKVYNGGVHRGVTTLWLYGLLTIPRSIPIVSKMQVWRGGHGGYGLRLLAPMPRIVEDDASIIDLDLRFGRGLFTATCPRGHLEGRGSLLLEDGTELSGAVSRPCVAKR